MYNHSIESQNHIAPQLNIVSFEMDDPTFEAGSTKTAIATMTNPTAREFTYDVELYLSTSSIGADKAASSGVGSITIPGGGSSVVHFTVEMPLIEGEYYVFVNVVVDGTHLVLYKATENVIIVVTPAINIDFIGWE